MGQEGLPQNVHQRAGDGGPPFRSRDQVLADFQLQVVEASRVGVEGDGVVEAIHGVGLIVAHRRAPTLAQAGKDSIGKGRVGAVQHPEPPGTGKALEGRREAVQRNQDGWPAPSLSAVQHGGDAIMIGCEDVAEARPPVLRSQTLIAGDGRAIAHHRDRAFRPGRAIAVDDQPRIALVDEDGVQAASEVSPQARDADVPGDVARQVRRAQAQIPQPGRNGAAGVIAQEQKGDEPPGFCTATGSGSPAASRGLDASAKSSTPSPMSILSIRHLTRYRYRKAVALGEHRMMFRPLESYDQRLMSSTLTISPEPSQLRYIHDVFGNCVGVARFAAPARELTFDSRVTLEHKPLPAFAGVDGEIEAYGETMPFSYRAEDMPDLLRSMERQHPDPDGAVERWARSFVRKDGRTGLQALLADMTWAIHGDFRYRPAPRRRAADAAGDPGGSGTGSCRDFALLMIEAVRSLGLAAQFVSGYIYSPPRHLGALTRLGGGHTHAWVRVYLPACGWVEFDPTNGIVGNADLVRVADRPRSAPGDAAARNLGRSAGDFLGMDVEVDVISQDDSAAYRQRRNRPRCGRCAG